MKISPDEIYTTEEACIFLKISKSTIKRWLKEEILRANKVGGRYKIFGKELLRLVSPKIGSKVVNLYLKTKKKVKKRIGEW